MNLGRVVAVVLKQYSLPLDGCHGVAHWARVLENGLRLANETGAVVEVVSLFAVLHDSQRLNEGRDPDHGPRAAVVARELCGREFELEQKELELLMRACEGHTHELTDCDITVQTCWDSDRLDLGRVGITPSPSRLCTDFAKQPHVIQWADARADARLVPQFVLDEWGIELSSA